MGKELLLCGFEGLAPRFLERGARIGKRTVLLLYRIFVSCNSRLAIRARMGHICGMAGTVGKRGGYSYAQVESALGTLFRVPASALGSFRGRVRRLQRIGLDAVSTAARRQGIRKGTCRSAFWGRSSSA